MSGLAGEPTGDPGDVTPHTGEVHTGGVSARLNWLRAGVLGANDGIVSVAGIVVGVAGATSSRTAILTAGVAGLVAGAISMALGEYVSVSSQRDSERALLRKERWELEAFPDAELDELTAIYQAKGLRPETARQVAVELTQQDPLRAHLEAELNIDPEDLVNPVHAAVASAVSFTVGAILPLITVFLPVALRVPVTVVAVLVALAITGAVSARLGGSSPRRAVVRLVVGGAAGLALTYGIGHLFGATVG